MKLRSIGLIIAGVLASGLLTAQAAEILRLPDSVTLSDTNYWDGGVAPGGADVALFDGTTVPDTNSIAYSTAGFYPGGWKFTDINGPVSFDGNAYLYGNGVELDATAAADVTFNALRVGNAPGFGPMTIAPGRTVTTGWISTSSGKSAYVIPISGGGTILVNGTATATSSRMMFNVSGSGTTIGGNGTWAPYWANSGYGIQIGTDAYIAPGNNGVGTMTINGANDGQTTLIMADGSGFKFEIGSGGTYALPSDNSDKLILTGVVSNDVVFQGTTYIDCLGTGSDGVFKLLDTTLDATTWSGLTLSGQEIIDGLMVVNFANGFDYSLILGDGTIGDAGDIYLVVGEIAAPYTPANLTWAVGDGEWDINTSLNWDDGAGDVVYYEEGGIGDNVTLNDTATGPWPISIALNTNVYPSAVAVDSTADYTITGTGSINGKTALTKAGGGTLTLGISNNSYSGGTTIGGGTVALSAAAANLGSGSVTLSNDTLLIMYNGDVSEGATSSAFANPLNIPAGETGTVWSTARGNWSGTLTGSGTLNLRTTYIRGDVTGNWSAFNGQINVTSRNGADDFRIALGYGSGLQLPSGKLHLGDGVYMYQTVNANSGEAGTPHNIGELSGTSGAIIGGNPIGGRYANWTVGALNTDSTFAGTIRDTGLDSWGGLAMAKLTKVGTGTLTLSGTNTYSGATTVNGGTLYISGAIGASSNVVMVSVATNAAIGGGGSIGGSLTLSDGARFAFINTSDTLSVSNSLIFNNTNNSFGVEDIDVDDWGSVSDGTYTLIDGFTNTVSGIDGTSYNIGSGREAHLEGGNRLQLVVGAGSHPEIVFSVSGGSAYLSWDNGGTYNVLTNSSLNNPGGWGEAVHGTSSPASIPIGSESKLFYGLGQ